MGFAAVVCSSGVSVCLKADRAAYVVDRSFGHTLQRIIERSILGQLTMMPQMTLTRKLL